MPHPDLLKESDAELVSRIRRDDAEALAALFDRYGAKVYGLARTLCRRADQAEEVVQAAFVSLWQQRMTFSQELEVGAWTMDVARERAIDADSRDEARDGDGPSWLAHLSQEQRDVIVLARYGGLTQAEIAKYLGISLATVRARMRYGLTTHTG